MRKALSGKLVDGGVQRVDHADTLQQKGRSPKRAPLLMRLVAKQQGYIFFSEQAFFAASHVPPAFSQSAAFFAVVTSPAKAGPVKASAKASANVETSVFMAVTPYGLPGGARRTSFQRSPFHAQLFALASRFWMLIPLHLYRHSLVFVCTHSSGGIATMSHLFAAILLFSSPGCPHEESTCIIPTEYVEVHLSLATGRVLHDIAARDAFGHGGLKRRH